MYPDLHCGQRAPPGQRSICLLSAVPEEELFLSKSQAEVDAGQGVSVHITRMCCQLSLHYFLLPLFLLLQYSVALKATLSGDHSGAGTLIPTSK